MTETETLYALLFEAARQLRSAVAMGGSVLALREQWEAMRSPRPGDYVLEMSSLRYDPDRIGVLTEVREDGGEMVHIVTTLDGREQRWRNAEFIRLPPPRSL